MCACSEEHSMAIEVGSTKGSKTLERSIGCVCVFFKKNMFLHVAVLKVKGVICSCTLLRHPIDWREVK